MRTSVRRASPGDVRRGTRSKTRARLDADDAGARYLTLQDELAELSLPTRRMPGGPTKKNETGHLVDGPSSLISFGCGQDLNLRPLGYEPLIYSSARWLDDS